MPPEPGPERRSGRARRPHALPAHSAREPTHSRPGRPPRPNPVRGRLDGLGHLDRRTRGGTLPTTRILSGRGPRSPPVEHTPGGVTVLGPNLPKNPLAGVPITKGYDAPWWIGEWQRTARSWPTDWPGAPPPRSSPPAGCASAEDCTVKLSRYNSTEWCALHESPASTQRPYDTSTRQRAADPPEHAPQGEGDRARPSRASSNRRQTAAMSSTRPRPVRLASPGRRRPAGTGPRWSRPRDAVGTLRPIAEQNGDSHGASTRRNGGPGHRGIQWHRGGHGRGPGRRRGDRGHRRPTS